jgi:hypothetical protein
MHGNEIVEAARRSHDAARAQRRTWWRFWRRRSEDARQQSRPASRPSIRMPGIDASVYVLGAFRRIEKVGAVCARGEEAVVT